MLGGGHITADGPWTQFRLLASGSAYPAGFKRAIKGAALAWFWSTDNRVTENVALENDTDPSCDPRSTPNVWTGNTLLTEAWRVSYNALTS